MAEQQFKIGELVAVNVTDPVVGSYFQQYGGSEDMRNEYTVAPLDDDRTRLTNMFSWYSADELSRPVGEWDRNRGRDLIEQYLDRDRG